MNWSKYTRIFWRSFIRNLWAGAGSATGWVLVLWIAAEVFIRTHPK